MVIFPLAPDQTIAQMWSNGARGPRDIWNWAQICTVYHWHQCSAALVQHYDIRCKVVLSFICCLCLTID